MPLWTNSLSCSSSQLFTADINSSSHEVFAHEGVPSALETGKSYWGPGLENTGLVNQFEAGYLNSSYRNSCLVCRSIVLVNNIRGTHWAEALFSSKSVVKIA
jgi:hypothetical protein